MTGKKQTAEPDPVPVEGSVPALAPEPEPEPQEKTYEVVGTQPVFDTQPGGTFTATLSREQEGALTEYGHIKVVENSSQPQDETEVQAPEEPEQTSETTDTEE